MCVCEFMFQFTYYVYVYYVTATGNINFMTHLPGMSIFMLYIHNYLHIWECPGYPYL